MKNLLQLTLTIAITLFCFNLSAQTSFRGSTMISGSSNLSFLSMENENTMGYGSGASLKQTSFEFSPEIGWFVSDDLVLGFSLPISSVTNKDDDGDKGTVTSYILAPMARHYLSNSDVRPFFEASLGFGVTKYKEDNGSFAFSNDSFDMNSFFYALGGGISFFLNENIALDLGAAYSKTKSKPKGNNNSDLEITNKGVSAQLGFTIIF